MSHPDYFRFISLLKQLGLAALYALLAKVSLDFFSAHGNASIVWPCSGLALAAVLVGGRQYGWGVFLGALLINLNTNSNMWAAGFISLGNTLEALLGAWLLTRKGPFDNTFQALRDYIRLIFLAGGVGSIIAALVGATTLLIVGFLPVEDYYVYAVEWWMGDVLGIILITPLILVWQRLPDERFERKLIFHYVMVLGLTFMAGQIIFLDWFHGTFGRVAFPYWIFLLISWAAVQLRVHGTLVVLMMVSVQVLVGAVHDVGIFSHYPGRADLLNYWFFIFILSIVGVALAIYFTEQGRTKTNEALLKSESFMKALTEFMPGMVGYWTKDLHSTFTNREYLSWFGKSQEEMREIRIQDLMGEELFRKSESFIRAALAGEAQVFERTLTKPNGEARETLAHYIPHRDANEVMGFFVLVLDITDRKHLEQALVSLTEDRQRYIGQELHDNLGQQIAAIGYQAKALEKKLFAAGSVETAQIAASIATQAQHSVMQCKHLAQGLLPFELEANGLIGALQAFASTIAITYGIACHFDSANEVVIDDGHVALNLYRIAQEAIQNAILHGGAKYLTIALGLEKGMLHLSICDDGCGFAGVDTNPGVTTGMGIKIMHYRAKQLGATIEFLSRAEGGMEVRLEMQTV